MTTKVTNENIKSESKTVAPVMAPYHEHWHEQLNVPRVKVKSPRQKVLICLIMKNKKE
jgi:hypothetical protein